jgi:hypothetical protein
MIQTANVDYTLQNLDDSINQTIHALNQVRWAAFGTVTPNAYGFTPGIGGLAHAAAQNAFVNGTLGNQFANPYANAIVANAFMNPFANPYALATATGIGHSAFNPAYATPFNNVRFAQTNPFTRFGYSPYAWPTV